MKNWLVCLFLVCLAASSCSHPAAAMPELPQETALYPFSEGVAGFIKGDASGFMNTSGKTVLDLEFHDASVFSEGLAAIKLVQKWGYVNHKGKYVVNPQFDGAGDFSEGLAPVKMGNAWGYIDKKGRVVIDFVFQDARKFVKGLAAAENDGKWGFIDKKGRYAIKHEFLQAGDFGEEGLAPVKTSGEQAWGFLDTSGKMAIKPLFEDAQPFSGGVAAVKDDTLWGFIDEKARFVINPRYGEVLSFSEGLAAVMDGHGWGYINLKGKIVIKPAFEGASRFSEGVAAANNDGQWSYIGPKGDKILAITGVFAGRWKPPSVNLSVHHDVYSAIHNYSNVDLLITTQNISESSHFWQLNNLWLPANSSYLLKGTCQSESDFNGYLVFQTASQIKEGGYLFKVWLFTASRLVDLCCWSGLTLLDAYGNVTGTAFSNNNKAIGMYDEGVKLVANDITVYLSKTFDKCYGPYTLPGECGTCDSPLDIMIVPNSMPMPKPY